MKLTTSTIVFFSVFLAVSLALPTPQENSEDASEKKGTVIDDSRFEIEEDSDVKKASEEEDDDAEENPIGDLVGGFFGLLQGAIGTAQKLAADENVSKTVNGLLAVGANATGQLIAAGGELLQSAPQVLERSGDVAQGLVKVTDETKPVFQKNLKDLERFGNIFAGFIRQYSDVAIKNLQDFLGVYDRRFKCHSECKTKTGEARVLCDQLYCDGFDPEYFEFDEDLDYLVETYGDLEELEKKRAEEKGKEEEEGDIKPRVQV